MAPGLGNQCSILLSYGGTLFFLWYLRFAERPKNDQRRYARLHRF